MSNTLDLVKHSLLFFPKVREQHYHCTFKKQGLRRTRKLRQCTNWKANLRICKLAKASNKKNWSVQLVRPAGLTCRPIYTLHLTRCILHVASYMFHLTRFILHVASYTLNLTHCILNIPCYKMHLAHCFLHIASYTLHLTQCILQFASYALHLSLHESLKSPFQKSLENLFKKSLKHKLKNPSK